MRAICVALDWTALQVRGHFLADLDPLGITTKSSDPMTLPGMTLDFYGLSVLCYTILYYTILHEVYAYSWAFPFLCGFVVGNSVVRSFRFDSTDSTAELRTLFLYPPVDRRLVVSARLI